MCNEHLDGARVLLIEAIVVLDRLGESLAAVRVQEAIDVIDQKSERLARETRKLRH